MLDRGRSHASEEFDGDAVRSVDRSVRSRDYDTLSRDGRRYGWDDADAHSASASRPREDPPRMADYDRDDRRWRPPGSDRRRLTRGSRSDRWSDAGEDAAARADMDRLNDNLHSTRGLLRQLRTINADISECTTVWVGQKAAKGRGRGGLADLMREYLDAERTEGDSVLAEYDRWQVWLASRVKEIADMQHLQRSASIAASTAKQESRKLLPAFNRLRASLATLRHLVAQGAGGAGAGGASAASPRVPPSISPVDVERGTALSVLFDEQCDAVDDIIADVKQQQLAPRVTPTVGDPESALHALSDGVSRLQSALLLACAGRNRAMLLNPDRQSPQTPVGPSAATEARRIEGLLEYLEKTAFGDADAVAKLHATIRDQEAELDEAAERDRGLRQQIADLERQLADANGGAASPGGGSAAADAELADLRAQLEAAEERVAREEAQAGDYQQEIAALADKVAVLEADKQQLEKAERDKLTSGVDDLYDEIAVLKSKLQAAELKLGSRSTEDGLHREITSLSQELEDTRAELARAQEVAQEEAAAAEQLYEELLELKQARGDRKACASQTEESGNISDEYERILEGVIANEDELKQELEAALARLDEREQELQDAYDKLAKAAPHHEENLHLRERAHLLESALLQQQASQSQSPAPPQQPSPAQPSPHSVAAPAESVPPGPPGPQATITKPRTVPVRKTKNSKFPYLGLVLGALRSEIGGHGGLRVVDVSGPAFAAGLQANDIITEVEGVPVNEQDDLKKVLEGFHPREAVYMKLVRDGLLYEVDVQPAESEIAPGQGARYTTKVIVKPKQNLFQITRSPPKTREAPARPPTAHRQDKIGQQARDLTEQSNAIFRKHGLAGSTLIAPPSTTRGLRH